MGDNKEEAGEQCWKGTGNSPMGMGSNEDEKGVWNPCFLSLVFCRTGAIWKCKMVWRLCLEEEEKEEEGCSHCPARTGFLSSVAFPAPDFPRDELDVAPHR